MLLESELCSCSKWNLNYSTEYQKEKVTFACTGSRKMCGPSATS